MSDCIIELGTEELPPKALNKLSMAFRDQVAGALSDAGLAVDSIEAFATPRRLGLLLKSVQTEQAEQRIEKRGPAVKAAFDADGNPTKAAEGFARGCGVAVSDLEQKETDKGAWLYFEQVQPGQSLAALLPGMVDAALGMLPIPKRMRWGDRDDEFVRPVKWLLLKIDDHIVDGEVLGLKAGGVSYGHRFHAPAALEIANAADYESALESNGRVIPSFAKRRAQILEQIESTAKKLGGVAHIDEDLLNEVTALVELPVAVSGGFDDEFLQVPSEALVMTMQDNQKYFAIFDDKGAILPHFITISNIDSSNPASVSNGNERVIRPRFADAKFFFEQDQKQSFANFGQRLDTVVFQNKLGTIAAKVARVKTLAEHIAGKLDADTAKAGRAAELCKNDLLTDMVGEFAKLQGIMGRYYALASNEDLEVAQSIEQHYWPKFAGDKLPETTTGQCVALADRLDTLLGIFAIGQKPTGVKDPFALRRAALGVVRILIEKELALDLQALCERAASQLPDGIDGSAVIVEVVDYILDRLRGYYAEQDIRFDIVDAVLASPYNSLADCDLRITAVNEFQKNDAAEALAAANKRIGNILKKQDGPIAIQVDPALLTEPAEKSLFEQLNQLEAAVAEAVVQREYLQGLNRLAELRPAVDQFFDDVMVMVDDEALKNNRLALLKNLSANFFQIADFSRLQG